VYLFSVVAMSASRREFDSAYANLEQTVRNFTRDKLNYEEAIRGLQKHVRTLEEAAQRRNCNLQTLIEEKRSLEGLREEDQTAKCALEAM
jgi:exonuclease VII small subunit